MAVNPQLFPNGMPVPFVNEMFVLARDGVEFEVDKIPGSVLTSPSSSYFSMSLISIQLTPVRAFNSSIFRVSTGIEGVNCLI